jgi:tetratricopeptide (TPR) repeat protein
VGELIESMPEGERKQGNRATLLRNRAIIYRQMGKYGKSISLLLAEAKSRPEDDSLQHTLAVLYLNINRYAEALNYIEKALSSRAARIDKRLQASYLVTRAMVRWRLGDAEEGVADLMHASDILPPASATLTRRIACAALEFYPASGAARAFVEKCKAQLAEALREEDFKFDPSQHITFLFQLGKRLVREGDARAAQDLLERERRWLDDDGVDFPWQLYHLRGLIAYGLGEYEETWGHLKAALERLERDVPVAEDAAFATFWMQDKESFQMELASVCLDLFERGHLGTAELLGVYEFMNGKEISARVERRAEAAATPVSERLAAAVRAGAGSKAFVFFEAGEKIAVLCVPLDGGRAEFVEGLTLSTPEVVSVRRLTQAAFKTANPADLSRLDAQLAPWRALAARLGESLAPYLSGCERVCFLPGRAFTGLPLHLLQLPGGAPLLERMPVVYAPNFSVLLTATRRADASDVRAGTVVTVMKRTEPRHFVERAYSVSDRLVALLGGGGAARWLKGAEADHESVRAALAVSSEAVFICHGTTAGPEKGYGICIADGGDLPPSLLPVSELPELGRFILTWQDIDGLARSPELFVSVACSTGVTEVAGGGVRFGLEQSLFGTGTRQIVSPLWDVEQESALRWLEHFFGARAAHPEWAVDEAFRHAGLSLSREFNHPYFWGAFILNGSAMPEVR